MPAAHLGGTGVLEPLGREAANRLEHRETAVAPPQQVVVDQHGQAFERHVAHALGGLQRAAAGEDPEAGEGESLVGAEQVVAPLDRGYERLLAGGGVARSGTGQVRLALEALENLGGLE
jgi:hypothetical protein